jgi:hypothetical protein
MLAFILQSSCLSLSSAGVIGISHQAWLFINYRNNKIIRVQKECNIISLLGESLFSKKEDHKKLKMLFTLKFLLVYIDAWMTSAGISGAQGS